MYVSPKLAELTNWLKSEFDRVIAQQTQEQRAYLGEVFKNSVQYEIDFWQMAYEHE